MRRRLAALLSFVLAVLSIDSAAEVPSRGPDSILRDGFDSPDAGPYLDADAARFLAQATFGPTEQDIDHLRAIGYRKWLDEQFDAAQTPPTRALDYLHWAQTFPGADNTQVRMESWFLGALGGIDPSTHVRHTDQLRQRVAFALSQIFVTSDAFNFTIQGKPAPMAAYYDLLVDGAFGNYRQLLENVTLSPAMGVYLSMLGNQKPSAVLNIRPDENYAREVMQLFSIGLVQLNLDGTPLLVGGRTVPAYSQLTVKGFAHTFTGWNFNGCSDWAQFFSYLYCANLEADSEATWVAPMAPVEVLPLHDYHDIGSSDASTPGGKQLLDYAGVFLPGGVLPAYQQAAPGQAAADMQLAIDNIFHHPNVGPFISKQLIQRLVTSNPSPAYVARVARVFNDDGTAAHERGNLRAVVEAILLDREARSGQWVNPGVYGKLREPILRLTHLWRVMDARQECGTDIYANPHRYTELHPEGYLAQAPLRAPSVFNFYLPDFSPSGEMELAGKVAPEIQITTDSTITSQTNALQNKVYNYVVGAPCYGSGPSIGSMRIDPARDLERAADVDALVTYYDLVFMSGQMSPFMRTTLTDYLRTLPTTPAGLMKRIQDALFLVITSPEYAVQQ